MKKLLKKRLNQKGFTLIELLAVIVILAIIAAIAIPAISSIIQKQSEKSVLADAQQVISAAKLAYSDGACTEGDTGITCTAENLKTYLDDVKNFNGKNDTVTKSTDGAWTINWKSYTKTFKKIEDATVDGATEKQLNDWMK